MAVAAGYVPAYRADHTYSFVVDVGADPHDKDTDDDTIEDGPDGLEDEEVHRDPPEKREAALRMALNIVHYALTH